MTDRERIEQALSIAVRYGGFDGEHHKAWAIDQMVRALTGCPTVERSAVDARGKPYTFETFGESAEYLELVREACDGEDGPDSYVWDRGIAP
jgi:hypothetical protein